MGYYTDFTVIANIGETSVDVFENSDHKKSKLLYIKETLAQISAYDFYHYDGQFVLNDAKWYDHTQDMIELSKKFPDVFFMVLGVGEEKDDEWTAYYRNGKHVVYHPEKIWPEFKEEDLK